MREVNSIVTNYMNNCLICGTPSTDVHHLSYGRANRRLSDEDGLVIPVCRECHTLIHKDARVGTMSKIIGQLAWERWYIGDFGDADGTLETARIGFRQKYGKSFL